MAEAGEVDHWEILDKLNEKAAEDEIGELVEWALPFQERHLSETRQTALAKGVGFPVWKAGAPIG